MAFLLVFIGGGLGSLARYSIGLASGKLFPGPFPLGTFISNILACLVLGITLYWFKDKIAANSWIVPLFVTGFCGGFSTFSALSKETLDLIQQGNLGWAAANIFVSVCAGIGLIFWMKTT